MEFLIPLLVLLVVGVVLAGAIPRGRRSVETLDNPQGRATVEERPAGRD